jgi:dynein heavy chain
MQMIDSPEIFGLHANADLNFRQKESIEMIDTIIQTRPKDSSSGGGKTREEIVQDQCKEYLLKIPTDYNISEVKELLRKLPGPKGLAEKGLAVPLNVFLYQEIQRLQKILSIVRNTCQQIVEAIDGQIIMTPQIVCGIDSIADAKVPNNWIYDAT